MRLSLGATAGKLIYDEYQTMLARNPGLKVVGEVEGQATRSVAQRNVAQIVPGLPKIDGVLGAGGNDSFGIVEGMLAAGYTMETMPPICTGADGDYIQWWREARDKHGYTATGLNADPEIGAWAVYYLAQDPARRRQRAQGLVRAVGADQQREHRLVHRRHRRADSDAEPSPSSRSRRCSSGPTSCPG